MCGELVQLVHRAVSVGYASDEDCARLWPGRPVFRREKLASVADESAILAVNHKEGVECAGPRQDEGSPQPRLLICADISKHKYIHPLVSASRGAIDGEEDNPRHDCNGEENFDEELDEADKEVGV